MPKQAHQRKVTGWRRKKLPNGRYLQIAVTKEAGPRGGHTVAYVQHSKGKTVYPAVETTAKRKPVTIRKRKHGRQVKVKRRG